MAELGKEWQPTDLLHYECEALTCALYGVPGVPINEGTLQVILCEVSTVLPAATNQGCSRKTCPAGLLSSSYMATCLDVQT